MIELHTLKELPRVFNPEEEARKALARVEDEIAKGHVVTLGFVTNVLKRACRGSRGAYDAIRGSEAWRVVQCLCL